ncbi:MAG: hypothetical protein Q8O90_05980 [Elusimicrobiota bacterium]|nr:hypothetical protein [Elusimicrobiota bacterium]
MQTISVTGLAVSAGFFLLLALPARRAAAGENDWTGNANLFMGSKALDKADWEPAHKQAEIGVEVDFKKRDWPVSIAIDFLGAYGEAKVYDPFYGEVRIESDTDELSLGIRKVWDGAPHVRPFIGGGVSLVSATGSVLILGTPMEASGSGGGFWLDGGVYWTLGTAFNLGLEFRTSTAKARISNQEIKAGGRHFGLLFGYHWGGSAKKKAEYRQPVPWQAPVSAPPSADAESGALDLELKRLEVERQKLELEKEKFEFEKQKAAGE